MRFEIAVAYAAPADDVARAYADPALYATFTDLPRAGNPQVLSHEVAGDVVDLRIRWAFTAQLSGAARSVIDPDRLSWVEASRHDLTARRTTFRMVADHYADRFSCAGEARVEPDGGACRRVVTGELKIKAPLVARAVENAIVSGLEEQLRSEVPVVVAFLG